MPASTLVILSSSPQTERHSSHLQPIDGVVSPSRLRKLFSVSPLSPQSPASRRNFTTAADLLVAEGLVQASEDIQTTVSTTAIAPKESTNTKSNRVQSFFPKYGVSKSSIQQRKYTAWNPAATRAPLEQSSQVSPSRRLREDSFGADDKSEGISKRHKGASASRTAVLDYGNGQSVEPSATPPFVDGQDFIAGLRAQFGYNNGKTDCFGMDVNSLRQEPPIPLRDGKRKKQPSKYEPIAKPKVTKARSPNKKATIPKEKAPKAKAPKDKVPKEKTEKKVKGPKTITGKAIAEATEDTVMLEAEEMDGLSDVELFPTIGSQPTPAPKFKAGQQKKSNVRSPTSVVRSIREQAVTFGSCSQLVSGSMLSTFREDKRISAPSKSISRPSPPKRSLWDEAACGSSDDGVFGTGSIGLRPSSPFQSPRASPRASVKSARPASAAKSTLPTSTAPLTQAPPAPSANPSKPNFNGFTDSQLMHEVSKCGFKPMKNRKRLIALAEQCWEGKQRLRSESVEPSVATRTKPAPTSAPKSQVNSRKKVVSVAKTPASTTSIEDILEEEDEEETDVMPKAAATSQTLVPDLTPVASSAHLHITKAVLAQHPTHDMAAPSWREKILLYDPILVEELTTWLNDEGLEKVRIDTEVAVADVRSWAESRGICCINSLTWKGKERRRV